MDDDTNNPHWASSVRARTLTLVRKVSFHYNTRTWAMSARNVFLADDYSVANDKRGQTGEGGNSLSKYLNQSF